MKNLVLGLLIGGIIGLWLGINIGRDKPLLSNPFDERSVHQKLKSAGEDILDSAGDAVKKGGDELREKFKE